MRFSLGFCFADNENTSSQITPSSFKNLTAIRIGFLILSFTLGLTPVFMGYLLPSQYEDNDLESVLEQVEQTGFYETSGLDAASLKKIVSKEDVVFQYGRLLYPRFLDLRPHPILLMSF